MSSKQFPEPNFGTPEYLPPEFYKSGEYNIAGDWWAYGCFIYELVTGVPPFFNVDSQRMISRIVCKNKKGLIFFFNRY